MPVVAPLLLLHVALTIAPGTLPPRIAAAAVAEAAAIWRPQGVVVDAGEPCRDPADDTVVLTVVVTPPRTVHPPFAAPPLGAIEFDGDAPAPTITVFLGNITRFIATARVLGAAEPAWPTVLRERIVGRAIGRVVAHEIGHYLLRMRQHTRTGLMRAMHSADDFVSPVRTGFELSRAEAGWLTRQDAAHEKGPAAAGPSNDVAIGRTKR
jgi:hypothetical protein